MAKDCQYLRQLADFQTTISRIRWSQSHQIYLIKFYHPSSLTMSEHFVFLNSNFTKYEQLQGVDATILVKLKQTDLQI